MPYSKATALLLQCSSKAKECDARADARSTKAGYKNIFLVIEP